jgi:uncharacterized membrane protein
MPDRLPSTSSDPKHWCKVLSSLLTHAKWSPPPPAQGHAVAHAPWILLAVSLATALRVFRLGRNSLWVDELASLQVASVPFALIPEAALRGNAFEPPIYFWLLHASMAMFGTSEAALRALSVLAGVLTVPLVWLLVRELSEDKRSASFAALLLALNPLHLWYSQEARPYSLMLLFAAASLLCLCLAMRGRGALWAGYTVFGALAILTHLTGIVVPVIGAGLVLLQERRAGLAGKFVAFSAGMGMLILPFLLALANSIEPGSTGSPPRALTGLEAPYSVFTYLAGYSLGPSVREIQNFGWQVAVERHPVQTLIAGVSLAVILVLVLRVPRASMMPLGILLIVPLAVPILGSAATSKAFNVRYTLPALIGFVGLMGVAVAALRPRARGATFAALLAVSLWADAQWFFLPRYGKEDSRAAVGCLAERGLPGATVAVAPRYMKGVLEYYAGRAGYPMEVVGVSAPEQVVASRASALLTTRLHHVPDESALVRAFRYVQRGRVLEGGAPGYRIHVAAPGEAAAGWACRTTE